MGRGSQLKPLLQVLLAIPQRLVLTWLPLLKAPLRQRVSSSSQGLLHAPLRLSSLLPFLSSLNPLSYFRRVTESRQVCLPGGERRAVEQCKGGEVSW